MAEKVLIISNNPLSFTTSNGKTIASLFDGYPKEDIAQLYFSEEMPTIDGVAYFKISDRDIIKGKINISERGHKVDCQKPIKQNNIINKKTYNDFERLLRELIWYKSWKSKELLSWVDSFSPQKIFFVAGDCVFAYNIYLYLLNRYGLSGGMYITDDYFMFRRNETVCSYYRRLLLRKYLRKALDKTEHFYTISLQMKNLYLQEFNKNSMVVSNIVEPLDTYIDDSINDNTITITYAGSLYYGREDSLDLLVEVINRYNSSNNKKAMVHIFGNINKGIIEKYNQNDGIVFEGLLQKDELYRQLAKSDILLLLESFDEKNKEKVRYSFSTKIPEYLSLEKPILAIGPSDVASINYIEDVGLVIDSPENVENMLYNYLTNDELLQTNAKNSLEKYYKYHKKDIVQKIFLNDFFN